MSMVESVEVTIKTAIAAGIIDRPSRPCACSPSVPTPWETTTT